MKLGNVAATLAALAAGATVGAGVGLYASRVRTLSTVRRITHSETPYDLYAMDVSYPYSLDRLIGRGLAGDQDNIDAILREALPLVPVHMQAPQFGCSAFTLNDGESVLMGRNYDFKLDTSAMLVHAKPADGYESIGFCALDNLGANAPLSSASARMACLAAPFACLDGVNEKGVSIAVLTLDSRPTHRVTGKPVLSTPLAIRLVLDRAAATQEAVDLLLGYDMFATSGRDYHFYITDASGDGRVLEYDCDSPERLPQVTTARQVTNFFVMHKQRVLPNQKNGQYGHGRERYDAIERVLDGAPAGEDAQVTAWRALRAASQEPNPEDVTSNTQWSVVFDTKNLTADVALRRRWGDVHHATVTGAVL